ncbi:MAG: class I SAM-dependent methyltransferase [Minisyncoccia bacterium]
MNLVTKKQKEYSLIDSGDGEKLERFGDFLVIRPEAQALWAKGDGNQWQKANAVFKTEWSISKNTPNDISLEILEVKTKIQIGKGRNIGFFPEYVSLIELLRKIIRKNNEISARAGQAGTKILNLFAHTGFSSIVYAKAGGEVVHVDSSRSSNEIAKDSANTNGAGDKIRFITEDALDFMKREVRRGQKYDLIILDPPSFGRGDKGQVFKIEEKITELIEEAKKLLSINPIGILLSGYSSEFASMSYSNVLAVSTGKEVINGTLSIEEEGGRLSLPLAKWAFACGSSEIKDIILKLINNPEE